jgi:hypothetical protein
MVSKRVMLALGLVVGATYILAIERVSLPGAASLPASEGDHTTSVSSAQQQPRPAAQSKADEARMERELAELTLDMARLKSDLSNMRDDKQPASEPVVPQKTAEEVQAEHDEYMVSVERAFEQEPRNDAWAKDTSQLLREALGTEPIVLAAVSGIECRSSSCRMEIRDDGSASFAEEFPIMVHQMGAVLPEVRFNQSDLGNGSRLHILYMTNAARAE